MFGKPSRSRRKKSNNSNNNNNEIVRHRRKKEKGFFSDLGIEMNLQTILIVIALLLSGATAIKVFRKQKQVPPQNQPNIQQSQQQTEQQGGIVGSREGKVTTSINPGDAATFNNNNNVANSSNTKVITGSLGKVEPFNERTYNNKIKVNGAKLMDNLFHDNPTRNSMPFNNNHSNVMNHGGKIIVPGIPLVEKQTQSHNPQVLIN